MLHQDNSFLYSELSTCRGLWLALEDAIFVNGCLWSILGFHKSNNLLEFGFIPPPSSIANRAIKNVWLFSNGFMRRFVRDENGA